MAGGGHPAQQHSTGWRRAAPRLRLVAGVVGLTALGAALAPWTAARAAASSPSTAAGSTTTTTTVAATTTTTTTTPTTTAEPTITTTTQPATTTTSSSPSNTTTVPGAASSASPPSGVATIRAEQAALVIETHQVAIYLASQAQAVAQTAVTADQLTLDIDQAQAAAAAGAVAAARSVLSTDRSSWAQAGRVNEAAQARLTLDRDQLRGLAIGVYTGALSGPQPADLQSLSGDQQADLARGEAEIVAQVVVTDLASDVGSARTAGRQYQQAQDAVGVERHELAAAVKSAAVAAARIPPDAAALTADQHQLAIAQRQLQQDHAQLTAALTALGGPPSLRSVGLSLLGTSALDAADLVAWYNAQGYTNLTAVTITQLANWYIQAGAAEGVRGDVAFAQAVLETGGFSSPDAIGLNNYAGIGHCDSCAAGWAFPSPHAGVIGHLQLLRIFATVAPAPRQAPAPVLPALTTAEQSRAGCCPTWESLTGVWASDPLYAFSILTMYEGMLTFAATLPPPAPGSASPTAASPTPAGPSPVGPTPAGSTPAGPGSTAPTTTSVPSGTAASPGGT